MPGRPRCCSLPSQTAPVGRSLPYADGRVAPRQKRRANWSSSRVAGPYISVLMARHWSSGSGGSKITSRSVDAGIADTQ